MHGLGGKPGSPSGEKKYDTPKKTVLTIRKEKEKSSKLMIKKIEPSRYLVHPFSML